MRTVRLLQLFKYITTSVKFSRLLSAGHQVLVRVVVYLNTERLNDTTHRVALAL